jgi:hypothetical protein
MRHEILSQQSCGPNGKYSNPRPKDLFQDINYTITPTSKNALAGVRTIKQVYNLKSEMTKNLHSAWGINGKCKFEDLNKIICETRKEDRDGRLLLHKMNATGPPPDMRFLGIVRRFDFNFDADYDYNGIKDYKDSTNFKFIMIPRNGVMLAHDQNVDGRGTWVYDGSKSEIDFGTKVAEGSCN